MKNTFRRTLLRAGLATCALAAAFGASFDRIADRG